MIKKFNEYSLNEEIERPFNISDVEPYKNKIGASIEKQKSQAKLIEFYNKMKEIVNYDEDEYEQGDEPTRSDLSSEVGSLMDDYELTTDDLERLIRMYNNDQDIEWYVKPQLEFELKQSSHNQQVVNILKKYGVTEVDAFIKEMETLGLEIVNKW